MLLLLLLPFSVFKNLINEPTVNPENKVQSTSRSSLCLQNFFFYRLSTKTLRRAPLTEITGEWFSEDICNKTMPETENSAGRFGKRKMRNDLKVSDYYSVNYNLWLELSCCALQLWTRYIFTINICILNDHITRQHKIHPVNKAATVLYF